MAEEEKLSNEDFKALRDAFSKEVAARAQEVDPSDRYVWEGIALGFAIGRGWTVAQAHDFARRAEW